MSTFTPARVGMSLEEFIELGNQQPFELINGERKPKLPNVAGHNEVAQALFLALHLYAAPEALGVAVIEGTFILPDTYDSNWVTGSRIPDVMFYAGNRLAQYREQNPDYRERPYAIVPDLVIEVVSPNDKVSDLDEKIDAYLQDGVRLIWVFDPQRRKVTVHDPDQENPIIFRGDAILDGGDVLPNFRLSLSQIFG